MESKQLFHSEEQVAPSLSPNLSSSSFLGNQQMAVFVHHTIVPHMPLTAPEVLRFPHLPEACGWILFYIKMHPEAAMLLGRH